MDRIIYTAMSGANAATQRQAVLANNLANASTQGFRAELVAFRAVPIQGDGATTRVFSAEATTGHSTTPGAIQRTGRSLDAAAKGDAWFAVQGLNGTEAYTRNGSLEVSPDGTLLNANGLQVLSDGGAPITVPVGTQVTLGGDGTITGKLGNQPASTLGRLKLVTPSPDQPIQRGEDGLFRSPTGEPLPSDPAARMEVGAIEGSNVNPIETMVGMIAVARQFETQMRMLQNAETNDKTASRLLSLNG